MKGLRRISLPTRIAISLSALSLLLTVSAGAFYYISIKRVIIEQISSRLMDVGRTGAYLFSEEDRAAIERLAVLLDKRSIVGPKDFAALQEKETLASLRPRAAADLMATPEFARLVQLLRQIKEGSRRIVSPLSPLPQRPPNQPDSPLVRFAYILVPVSGVSDLSITRFLADADYEELDINGDGKIADDEQGNAIGTVWRTPADAFRVAMRTGEAAATKDWYQDKWGVWLTAAIPIKNRSGRVVAVLGVDYDTRGEASLLAYFFKVTLAAVAAGLVLSTIVSWFLSRLIARPLRRLVEGVDRMAGMDLTAHVEVESDDEVGRLARAFNGMVQAVSGYAEGLKLLNRSFNRFVPHAFLRSLGHDSVMTVKLGDQQLREMSVLFCDLNSFTTLSEKMSPAETIRFLNEFLALLSPVVQSHQGFIDKYIGDGIMALFDRPGDAIAAGVSMAAALRSWNSERAQRGASTVGFGIGVHHAPMVLGTVGTAERMDGTVISDGVNTAARLEALTRQYSTTMLVSAAALRAAGEERSFATRYLGELTLRGKQQGVGAFEILEALSPEQWRQKEALGAELESALRLVENPERRQMGIEQLYQLLERFPEDATLRAVFQNSSRGG